MENQVMRQNHSPISQLQHPLTSPTPFNGPKSQQQQHVDLDSFPPGYRFKPNDQELIECYLKRKVKNLILPKNRIHNVNIYKYNPDEITAKYRAQGEKEWYFFTLRERKYANGTRPNRTAGNGFWKATAADKGVKFNGRKIGCKRPLVFYEGKPQNGNKTSWLMQEFTVESPSNTQRNQNEARLDDYVLCKIYKRENKNRQLVIIDDNEGASMHRVAETEPIGMDCTGGYDQPPQTTEVPQYSLGFDGVNGNNNIEEFSTSEGTFMHNLSETELIGMNTSGYDQPPQIIEVPQYSPRFDGVNDNNNINQFSASEGTSMHNLSQTEPPRMDNGDYDQPPQTSTEVPHYLGFEELRHHQSYQQDMDSTSFGNINCINPNASWSIYYHQLFQDAFT